MIPVKPAIRRVAASRTGAITAAVFIAFAFELAPAALAQTVPASATTATTAMPAPAAAPLPSPCPPDWEAQLCELKAAIEVLKKQHLTDVDIGALLDATVHAGIKTLPYARFFNAAERRQQLDDEGRARDGTPGIGIVFETRPDGLHIIDVIPDAPAEKAGVRPDDLVVAMNDQSVVGLDSADVVKLAKGDAGVPLKLTIRRGPGQDRKSVV